MLKKNVRNFITRALITVIIFLIGMILVKSDSSIKNGILKQVYDTNFKFTKIKSVYEKYFGNILSVDKLAIDENVTIEWGKTIEIIVENEKMKGQIKIIKTSEDDNLITGELAGTAIQNVKFEIYDFNYNLVEEIITGEDGIATTKLLPVGKYIIKEVETGKHYLLNEDEMEVEITEDGEIIKIEITNKSEIPPPEIKRLPVTGY